jgi:hypothetical protein
MSSERRWDYLVSLTHELCALPRESERVAFHSGRHCTGGLWRGPEADSLSAFLGLGPKRGAGMSQDLDGNLLGCPGRLPGLALTSSEAAL